jgi:uncharacterized repeat protein (TIGR03806 family)
MRPVVVCAAFCVLITACEQVPPSVVVHAEDAIPDRLSDWNVIFSNGDFLQLNDAVVAYGLNTPLFTDYALKLRTVWLPDGTTAAYNPDRELDFPLGTIITKTFHYEKADGWSDASFEVVKADRESILDSDGQLSLTDYVLIETRLLIRYEDGWKALPYVWNSTQDEAFLELAGDYRNIELVGADGNQAISYVVPDANQCAGCHTPDHTSKEMLPLGPRGWQLNRPYAYYGGLENQLEHWIAAGILSGVAESPRAGVRWRDPGDATLGERAKAYLDANCAHCHNPAGAADTSALHLNIDAPVDRNYGICKTPVAVGRGSGDHAYDIYPGRPDESIVVYRMRHTDPAIAMPELGRSAVHAEGVELISHWISTMNGEC